jgi:hypothetical protein
MKYWKYPLTALPALALPVALYALGMFVAGPGAYADALNKVVFAWPMPAGVAWRVSWADLIALAGLGCLFADLLKSTSTGRAAVVNHVFSMGLLIGCLMLFLMAPAFVTSTFFLLMAMAALDVIAGFTITTISARRDVIADLD